MAGNGVAFTRLSVRIVPVSVALMGASDFTPPNTTANADVHPSENVSELVRIPEITIGKQEGRRAGGWAGEWVSAVLWICAPADTDTAAAAAFTHRRRS